MDTITAFFSALGKSARTVFDLAGMAVGVAPNQVPLADGAVLPMEQAGQLQEGQADWEHNNIDAAPWGTGQYAISRQTRQWLGRWS